MYGMCHNGSDREVIMAHIDHLRAKSNYLHLLEDCTNGKARPEVSEFSVETFFLVISVPDHHSIKMWK